MGEQGRIFREFTDPALEVDYRHDLFVQHQRGEARVLVGLVIGSHLLQPVLDYLVVPDVFPLALKLRFGLVLPVSLAVYALIATRHFERLFMAVVLLPMLMGWWMLFLLGAHAKAPGSHLFVAWPLIFTIVSVVAFKLTVRRALLTLLLVAAMYAVMEAWLIHSPRAVLAYMGYAYTSSVAIGVLLARAADQTLRTGFLQKRDVAAERARSEALLLNILPESIAQRLKGQHEAIADGHGDASVLFADVVGFTPLSEQLSPRQVVDLLNELFSRFDGLTEKHHLEKIKTIGDAYMVAGGVPFFRDDHVSAIVSMGLDMNLAAAQFAHERSLSLALRIGIHAGPVVAGVIGRKKFIYDLWGDTVNTASRMESHGVPGTIQVTDAVRQRLIGQFDFQPRGEIEVKGKGRMLTWLLVPDATRAQSPR